MQKADANPQSPTICRRFADFMLSMSLRPPPSRTIPLENGPSVHEESSFKSINKTLRSDIVVEFRHTDLEGNKASVHASKKGDLLLGNERSIVRKIPQKKDGFQIQQKTGRKYQEKELQDLEILQGTCSQFKVLETSISVHQSVDLSPGQAMKQKHLTPSKPLLRVDSKINEKAHEFIETKREAMWKSAHLDKD